MTPAGARWGIWGTGAVANAFAADFALVPDAGLCAVASRRPEQARHFAARHGCPAVYEDLTAMLEDPSVDVVYVATPHYRHMEDCIQCLEAGKAVLCEKPFAMNADQSARVVRTARDRGLFCMEAMWMRFIPAIVDVKQRIERGDLGDIRLLCANFAYPEPFDPESRFYSLQLAGGALLDRGVYGVSLACHLLGRPVSVSGTATIGNTGVDEQSACLLRFEGGALAELSSSLRVLGSNEAFVAGERGLIRLHAPFYRAHRFTVEHSRAPHPSPGDRAEGAGPGDGIKDRLQRTVAGSPRIRQLYRELEPALKLVRNRRFSRSFPGNGYQFQIAEVNRCLRDGLLESPTMPLDGTLEVMRVVDEIRSLSGPTYPWE